MKLTILLLTFSLFFALRLSAQNTYSVKGTAADTTAKARLANTTVSVLNAKDSTLVKFTRATKDGSFAILNLHKGKFILLVTYPEYADYVEQFSLDSIKTSRDFGRINMLLKAKLLADVIIKGTRAAIKIKGDTTEFNASAFVVQPNAKVEDLLKQLPGIQVDKDGKITAQGQTVSKVLVDGEEFFGDDPTLVTKNIRADMVDKVQLYDKKSDQAAFTGIDDGQKTKTINIELKADKKNGYFGQVTAGDGPGGYYQGQLLFNMFKAKEKFSVYSTVGNNGKTGLGWQDNQKYGASDNVQFGDDGGLYITAGSGDGLDSFSGQYSGQGLPVAVTGGLHYDSKWDGDKQSVNANYKAGSLQVNGATNTQTQSDFTGGLNNTNANETLNDFMFRQKLDVTYNVKLDTTSNLKIAVDGTLKNTHTVNNYFTTTRDSSNNLLNDNTRDIDNRDNTQIYDASAFYTKKFKKKGRTMSFLISESSNETNSNGYLKSTINYYQPVVTKPDSTQLIDQYKTSDVKSNILKTNLTYTEPMSKTLSLVFNYGFGVNNGASILNTFNKSAPGVYSVLVDSLSDNYKLNELSNQVGGIINYKKGKLNLNFGTKVSNVNFDEVDENTGAALKRDFINWNPQANLQYRFSQMAGLYLNYQGRTVQPTISQIQPVAINTDPLNVTTGNPGLTPSFTHSFNVNYNSYKVISGQSMFIYGNYSFTTNPIVSNMITDTTTGKSTTQYVNLGNRRQSNYYIGANFDKKIDKLGFDVGANLTANGSDSYNLSNNEVNLTNSHTYSGQITFSKNKEKKYDFYFDFGPNYTLSGSSLQPNINNNGRGLSGDLNFDIYLPAKFQIGSNDSYQWKGKTETFNTDFNQTLINAYISRTFLKDDKLKIELWANDLLNQNSGFSRTINANLITQNTYTTIKRYFMLSVIWDFDKMGGITK
jgi:hypothetical protein